MKPSSEGKVHQAAGWSLLSVFVNQIGQVVVTLVLAGILGPERFGVVALAALYILLVDFLTRQGISQAIIQRSELRDSHSDSAFVMIMGTSFVLALLTIVAAPMVAALFDAPALTNLLRVLAGVGLLSGCWQVPAALLERQLDFRARAIALNSAVTVGGIAGVASAFGGANEYAVVYQLYAQGLVAAFLIYAQSPWRPHIRFERQAARELLSFSSGALLASLGAFVSQRADTIVVGLFFGPLAVGLYRFASRPVQLVTNTTAGALGRVGLAALSRVQDDPRRFGNQTSRLMGSGAALAAPLLGIVFVGARVTVELFGDEWDGATAVMRILAIAGIARVTVIYANPIQQATGRAFQAAASLWFASLITIGTVGVFAATLASGSIESIVRGVAIARLAAQAVVIAPVFFVIIASVSSTTVRRLVWSISPALVVAAATIAVGLPLDILMSRSTFGLVVQGAVVGTVTSFVAAAGVLTISDEARIVVRKVQSRIATR